MGGATKKATAPPTVMDPSTLEGAQRHKDHWHTAEGGKFYESAANYEQSDLVPHKGHFHDKEGAKLAGAPGDIDEHMDHPDEEDVVKASVDAQRKARKRGVQKTSSLNTMLQSTGGVSRGHKLG